mmetsp:Transcript_4361/g.14461  ORF Transcript_4361/g.14461 Transcript_4361/m.14461 type:complete len:215 (+) Transcript_4361:584-1228(+)
MSWVRIFDPAAPSDWKRPRLVAKRHEVIPLGSRHCKDATAESALLEALRAELHAADDSEDKTLATRRYEEIVTFGWEMAKKAALESAISSPGVSSGLGTRDGNNNAAAAAVAAGPHKPAIRRAARPSRMDIDEAADGALNAPPDYKDSKSQAAWYNNFKRETLAEYILQELSILEQPDWEVTSKTKKKRPRDLPRRKRQSEGGQSQGRVGNSKV